MRAGCPAQLTPFAPHERGFDNAADLCATLAEFRDVMPDPTRYLWWEMGSASAFVPPFHFADTFCADHAPGGQEEAACVAAEQGQQARAVASPAWLWRTHRAVAYAFFGQQDLHVDVQAFRGLLRRALALLRYG